ncbi:tetraspanin-18-like [Amphibalanus amphitrite]|uniref:tetraspanin-18-like n=1 Tax=Amphibalanus amphitrite TaxID=1232801 RepID=UPI001C906BC9|nr:tetraspanin-18-like [Amphibalanus amphitrite]
MAMTDGCSNCLKYTFGFVNLVILICGGVLLGVGITALVGDSAQLNELLDTNLYTGVAIVITVAGGLIVLISFLGCCGAFQESKCLLGTFFCLVLILFIVVGAGAIAGFVMGSDSILEQIKTGLQKSMNDYNEKDSVQQSWNFLQENFECCGVDGPSDWALVLGPDNVPRSCCHKDREGNPGACSADSNSYDDGCVEKLEDFVKGNSKLFGAIAIAVAVFLLLSMIVACVIMKSIF